jgi:hypothetical protein
MSQKLWFCLLASAFLASPIYAANQVTVVEVTPSVLARLPPGDWKEVKLGDKLTEGYEIGSDPDGQVKLAFQDNSTVVIRPTSQVKIGSFFTSGGVVRTQLLLKVGDVSAQVNRKEGVASDFRIQTATATASVRGTLIHSVNYNPVNGLKVELTNGSLNITGLNGEVQLVGNQQGAADPHSGELLDPARLQRERQGSPGIPSGYTRAELSYLKQYAGAGVLRPLPDYARPTRITGAALRGSSLMDPAGVIRNVNTLILNASPDIIASPTGKVAASFAQQLQIAQNLHYPSRFTQGLSNILGVLTPVRDPEGGFKVVVSPAQYQNLVAGFNLLIQGEQQAGVKAATISGVRAAVNNNLNFINQNLVTNRPPSVVIVGPGSAYRTAALVSQHHPTTLNRFRNRSLMNLRSPTVRVR